MVLERQSRSNSISIGEVHIHYVLLCLCFYDHPLDNTRPNFQRDSC